MAGTNRTTNQDPRQGTMFYETKYHLTIRSLISVDRGVGIVVVAIECPLSISYLICLAVGSGTWRGWKNFRVSQNYAKGCTTSVAQFGKNPWWDQVQTNNYKVASEAREWLPHFGTYILGMLFTVECKKNAPTSILGTHNVVTLISQQLLGWL